MSKKALIETKHASASPKRRPNYYHCILGLLIVGLGTEQQLRLLQKIRGLPVEVVPGDVDQILHAPVGVPRRNAIGLPSQMHVRLH